MISHKLFFSAFTAVSVAVCGSSAMAAILPPASITLGSDNAGLGGFTAETTDAVNTSWATTTNAARFTNDIPGDSGQVNSSLLQEATLNRSSGSSYTFTSTVDWVSGQSDNNNRVGLALFADSADITGADTGLSLQLNISNGQMRIFTGGVNGSAAGATAVATYGGLLSSGNVFTYTADVSFTGTDVAIDFTLTDANSFSQTVSATVAAASVTGEYFGVASRARSRAGDDAIIFDVQSFEVVPEPASFIIFGLGATLIFSRRRS